MVRHEQIWVQKYAPKEERDIVGNPSAVQSLNEYLIHFGKKDASSNAVILVGPPGTGKTATAYVMASKYDYDLLEINASDVRNEEIINRNIGTAALKKSLKNKNGTIILVDEVDGISGVQDRGGIGALLKIIKTTKNPIILTANDLSDQKFNTLKRTIKEIKYKSIQKTTILKVLQKI